MLNLSEESRKKTFLEEFLQSGLDWKVNEKDLTGISTRKHFLKIHLRNCNSRLKLTRKALRFPIQVIFALSTIDDTFCTKRLTHFLMNKGRRFIETCKPGIEHKDTLDILLYLFQSYFQIHILDCMPGGEKIIEVILPDYMRMALLIKEAPDLRIKTIIHLLDEHRSIQLRFGEVMEH